MQGSGGSCSDGEGEVDWSGAKAGSDMS